MAKAFKWNNGSTPPIEWDGVLFMSEKIPIHLDGVVKGTLTVTREGLVTRFEGRCEDPGRLVRLSVYGGGKEGYLGVMSPERGALSLTRQISRAGMADFPTVMEYAAEAGRALPEAKPEAEKPAESAQAPRRGCATIPHVNARRCPRQEQPKREEEGLLWYPTGDGGLYTVWHGRAYQAIPMAPYGLSRQQMVEMRTIEGVEYAVYELDDEKTGPS